MLFGVETGIIGGVLTMEPFKEYVVLPFMPCFANRLD
jgi:hypothetical protein